MKKDHGKGKNVPATKVRATNINSRESFDYDSKRLDIHHASIGKVLSGIQKTATSKFDGNKYKGVLSEVYR